MHPHLKTYLLIASSIVISSPVYASCTLYQHRDYQGSRYTLGDGDAMIMRRGETICSAVSHGSGGSCTYHEPSWNDELSSFKVSGGCTMTLYENFNRSGARFRSNRSYKYVGSRWNDEVSEAYCTCP
jgi:hypothetical protein